MAQAYPRPQQGQAKSREEGGRTAPAGLWEHPESGQTAITMEDPLFGNAQSQAFLQAGFKFVREVDPSEIVTLPQLALDKQAGEREQLKGLSARLSALETVADENTVLKQRIAQLEAEAARNGSAGPAAQAGEDAKKAAQDQVKVNAARDAGTDPTEEDEEGDEDETPAKALDKQNSSELKATAEAEGVDVTEADTNKKLVAAIQAARDAKESEK